MPTLEEEVIIVGAGLREPLGMWVIYDHPTDFPDKFVARRFFVGPKVILASEDFLTSDTIHGIRALLPDGLANIGRYNLDEPQIAEVWV